MESRLSEKDVEVLVNITLNISKQRALAAKKTHGILSSSRNSVATGLNGMFLSLFLAQVRPHLEYSVQFLASQDKTGLSSH